MAILNWKIKNWILKNEDFVYHFEIKHQISKSARTICGITTSTAWSTHLNVFRFCRCWKVSTLIVVSDKTRLLNDMLRCSSCGREWKAPEGRDEMLLYERSNVWMLANKERSGTCCRWLLFSSSTLNSTADASALMMSKCGKFSPEQSNTSGLKHVQSFIKLELPTYNICVIQAFLFHSK